MIQSYSLAHPGLLPALSAISPSPRRTLSVSCTTERSTNLVFRRSSSLLLTCISQSASTSPSPTINPDEERTPPPAATLVYFPQNDIEFRTDEDWPNHLPDLFTKYSHITKPSDLRIEDLTALNVEMENDVDLEKIIPTLSDGFSHLPPPVSVHLTSAKHPEIKVALASPNATLAVSRDPLLSNGLKTPDMDTYFKFCRELICENDDALRVIWRKKAKSGHPIPALSYYRKFWGHLESLFLYWDTSLDHYYDLNDAPHDKLTPPKSPRGLKRLSVALGHKETAADAHKQPSTKRYKGRRSSTGSKMPEHFRVDSVRNFVEPLAWIFGCQLVNPRKTPQMEIRNLLVPVTQTSQVWRVPEDKANNKRGITEGPVLGIQCRGETGFVKDKHTAALDAAREIAGLMLLAQERAREGKTKEIPGEGKWYTTKPRWGGGPGGEFGEAEGNTDPTHHQGITQPAPSGRRLNQPAPTTSRQARSEEEIWKELKPGPGLWDPRRVYLAIGKDRNDPLDSVFMISSLFHHISILKLNVHPFYIDFMITGKAPQLPPADTLWYKPRVQRSRWFDLLVPADRLEAMRGIWGIMSYMMRAGESVSHQAGQRQKSEIHHLLPFRKKTHTETASGPGRSASVAF